MYGSSKEVLGGSEEVQEKFTSPDPSMNTQKLLVRNFRHFGTGLRSQMLYIYRF
jgi:hypothetical protein